MVLTPLLYTDAFSERWLLYRILDSFFPGDNVKYTGSQMKDSGLNAEPDYYARRDEHMYLFESKDILINAAVKEQYDFSLLEAEFKKKLYFEEKGGRRSNKAVLQLMGNIGRALTLQFPFDTAYEPQTIKIYPVLVLHDHSFRVPGLNHLVNSWFIDELDKLAAKGFPTGRVRNLTIIDMDTLIYRQDIFRAENLNLGETISDYHQYVLLPRRLNETDSRTAGQIMNNKSIAFGTWFAGRVDRTSLNKPPEMLDAMTKIIFNSGNMI